MTKVYVAVYQNVSLSNCNRMTLLTTLYLLGNIRYHEAKVKIRSMIRIYYLVTVLARYARCRGGSDRLKKMLDLGGDRFWHPQRVLCRAIWRKKIRAGDFFLNVPKCCKMLQNAAKT